MWRGSLLAPSFRAATPSCRYPRCPPSYSHGSFTSTRSGSHPGSASINWAGSVLRTFADTGAKSRLTTRRCGPESVYSRTDLSGSPRCLFARGMQLCPSTSSARRAQKYSQCSPRTSPTLASFCSVARPHHPLFASKRFVHRMHLP
jgi:hypothetical protein